ncbi:MAG: efflux RND transporter periplasmic adaptor subunit [Bryobacteraceae bacterium]
MRTTLSLALGATLLCLSGCAKKKEVEAEPVLPVQVAPVQRETIERVLRAEGVLRALDQSAVMPKISAPVKKFYVNRGDHVTAGQLLAILESRDLAAAVTDAKGAYDQASANYRNVSAATVPDELVKSETDVQSAKQGTDAAKNLLDSREQLFKEGALARRQVDEALVAYTAARSQYETARKHLESVQGVSKLEEVKGAEGQMVSAKGRYESAQAQLSYAEVRSPISGIVADRSTFAGEMATPGTPLLTVVQVTSVIARVNLPQSDAAFVRVGQAAKVISADGLVETKGKVTVVSPAVDPQGTTVEIWVEAPNPGEKLRPGAAVRVEINAGEVKDALVVPVEALLPAEEGGAALYVAGKDGVVHQKKVKTGVRTAEKVQVTGGVNAGDLVVVEGGVGLGDGAKVKIEQPAKGEEK